MSWWTKGRDLYEGIATLGAYGSSARHQEADVRYGIQDQMKAYKDAAEITKQETDRKRDETKQEKRRVEEKQIRALRGKYRPAGFLNNQSLGAGGAEAGVSNKLGG